jgi:DNA polymerase
MGHILHLDYESFSEVDIKALGAARYAWDPSAEIIMAAIALDDGEPVLWVNPRYECSTVKSDPRALELMEMWEDPSVVVYAHNAQFEMFMSERRIREDIGIEPPAIEQWRCTQTMARRAAIPPSLEKCAEYLELEQLKDNGLALIKRFCCPQKPSKKQPKTRLFGKDDPEAFRRFADYCLQDVRTEQEIYRRLKPFEFRGALLDTFIFDLKMNLRGVPVNRTALKHTQVIIDEVMVDLGGEFKEITGLTVKQNVKVAAWFKARGYKFKGMGIDLVEKACEDLSWAKGNKKTIRAIELRALLGFAATGKVTKMMQCDCGDGWVRGCFMMYGAGPGRWSAKLIQPQNFKKPSEHLKKHTPFAIADLEAGASRELIEILYGNPMDVISSSIRHFISAHE